MITPVGCAFYAHWNFIILMRGRPSTHPAARVPRGGGWLGIPSLLVLPSSLPRARACYGLLARAPVHSLALLFGLTRCARSCCLRPPLRSPRSLGWRVLWDTLVRACLLWLLACACLLASREGACLLRSRTPRTLITWVTLLRSAPALILLASLRSLLGITPLAQSVQRSFITSFLLIVIH